MEDTYTRPRRIGKLLDYDEIVELCRMNACNDSATAEEIWALQESLNESDEAKPY